MIICESPNFVKSHLPLPTIGHGRGFPLSELISELKRLECVSLNCACVHLFVFYKIFAVKIFGCHIWQWWIFWPVPMNNFNQKFCTKKIRTKRSILNSKKYMESNIYDKKNSELTSCPKFSLSEIFGFHVY